MAHGVTVCSECQMDLQQLFRFLEHFTMPDYNIIEYGEGHYNIESDIGKHNLSILCIEKWLSKISYNPNILISKMLKVIQK